MRDSASLVQQLNDLRAELLDQFGHGKALGPALHRLDRLAAALSADDAGNVSTPAPDVTPRTAEAFNGLLSLYTRTGIVPSIPEICTELRIHSPNGAEYHLRAMESAGLIRRQPKPPGRHKRRPSRAMVFLRVVPIVVAL